MSDQIDEFNNKVELIKACLPEFLKRYGQKVKVQPNGDLKLLCPHPFHKEDTPSAGVNHKFPHVMKCFGCNYSGNIFQINHFLTNAPLTGPQFVKDNVNVLCKMFGIPEVDMQLSPDQLERMKHHEIVKAASSLILTPRVNGKVDMANTISTIEYAQKLHISDDVIHEMAVGTILDYDLFRKHISILGGWTESDLNEAGIKKTLFNKNLITFTIFDEYGRPIAFAARDMNYDGIFGFRKMSTLGAGWDRSKWNNSSTSIIYNKSEILYGFHTVKGIKSTDIYLMEGYTDALVARSHGLHNVVCIGGTSFTNQHLEMLRKNNKDRIIFALDNDEAGMNSVDKILEDAFISLPQIRPYVIQIPQSTFDGKTDYDPDTFILQHGIYAFKKLEKKTAFEWKIIRSPDVHGDVLLGNDLIEKFLPLVCNEQSSVIQHEMVSVLSAKTGVNIGIIQEYKEKIEKRQDREAKDRMKAMMRKQMRNMDSTIDLNPEEALSTLSSLHRDLSAVISVRKDSEMSHEESIQQFDEWDIINSSTDLNNIRFITGWPMFDKLIGVRKHNFWYGIMGGPNLGKTAYLINMIIRLLKIKKNLDEGMQILVSTIDDDREMFYTKMVSMLCGHRINDVEAYASQTPAIQADITKAKQTVRDLVRGGHLLVKDQRMGTTAEDMISWIANMQRKFPDRQIVFFLDNFHKISGEAEERIKYKNASQLFLEKMGSMGFSIVATMEITKDEMQKRSDFTAGAESGQMAFDLKLCGNVFNEMGTMRNKMGTKLFWIDSKNVRRPIFEVFYSKNKVSTYKDTLYYMFNDEKGDMEEIGDKDALEKLMLSNKVKAKTSSSSSIDTYQNPLSNATVPEPEAKNKTEDNGPLSAEQNLLLQHDEEEVTL